MLILLLFSQNMVAIEKEIDSKGHETNKDGIYKNNEKGEWKTNFYCRIKVHVDGASCEPDYKIGFIKYAECRGNVYYCRINGLNGTDIIESGKWLHIRVKYLFGYTYLWWQSWLSESYMGGFAIKCEYRVGK